MKTDIEQKLAWSMALVLAAIIFAIYIAISSHEASIEREFNRAYAAVRANASASIHEQLATLDHDYLLTNGLGVHLTGANTRFLFINEEDDQIVYQKNHRYVNKWIAYIESSDHHYFEVVYGITALGNELQVRQTGLKWISRESVLREAMRGRSQGLVDPSRRELLESLGVVFTSSIPTPQPDAGPPNSLITK